MDKETRLTLVKINKLILSENYEESLKVSDDLLKQELDNFTLAEVYHQKAISFINLENYEDALPCLTKSYGLSKYYLDHSEYDKVFNRVYDTNFNKSYWLILCKKSMENSHEKDARNYFKRFLRSNHGVNKEFLLSFLGFTFEDILMEFQVTSKFKSFEQLSPSEISKFMDRANECISSNDYENAIKYLNKLGDYEPALKIKSDLLILRVLDNDVAVYDDYYGFWRNIGYLTEASKVNDEALLIKAYLLLDAGLFEKSLECYDSYLENHEKDKRALYGKVIVLNELGEYDSSLDIIETFPAKYWEYIKSEVLAIKGKSGTAVKVLNALLKNNENEVNALLTKALVYSIDLKLDKVLREYDKVLNIKPKNTDALLLKGEMLFGLHKYKKAIETFNKIPKNKLPEGYKKLIKYIENYKGENSGFYGVFKKDSSWEYVYVESDIFKRLKSRSLDDLKTKALKRGLIWKGTDRSLQMKTSHENNLKQSLETELLYDFNKNHNRFSPGISNNTIKSFDTILESDDKNYKILNNKGYVLLKLGKIDESIDCLHKAIGINPNDYHAWFNKGFAYINKGNYIEAKKCILKSLELNNYSNSFKNELGDYFYDLGWSLYESDKIDDSIMCYDICIELNPKISGYYNCKAISLECLEEYDAALELYDMALELNFDNVIIKNKFGCLRSKIFYIFDEEDYEGCVVACDEYLKFDDKDYFIWDFKGDSLRLLERFEEALPCFDKAIKYCDEDKTGLYNLKALSLECLNRFDDALEFFDKALALDPNEDALKNNKLNCMISKLYYLFNQEEYEKCVSGCDEYLKFNDENYRIWDLKGDSLRLLERFEEALPCFDKAIKYCDEENPQLYNLKAICLEYLDKFHEAIEFYDKALALDPDDEVIIDNKETCIQNKIDLLMENESYTDACEYCDMGISNFSDNSNFYNLKAICLEYLERFDDALEFYDKALVIDPDDEVLKDNKLTCIKSEIYYLFDKEDYEGCVVACDEYLKFDNGNAQIYNLKASSLHYMNKYDEAIDFYDKALAINPDEDIVKNKWVCRESKVRYLFDKEDYEGCVVACDEYLELDDKNPYVWDFKGHSLSYLERFEEAPLCFDKAIEFSDDDNAQLYNSKAMSLFTLEKYDEALKFFDKAIELEPGHESFKEHKRICYRRKISQLLDNDDLIAALKYCDEAIIMYPYDPDLYNYKAICLKFTDRLDEAIECIDKAIELDPNNKYFKFNKKAFLEDNE